MLLNETSFHISPVHFCCSVHTFAFYYLICGIFTKFAILQRILFFVDVYIVAVTCYF